MIINLITSEENARQRVRALSAYISRADDPEARAGVIALGGIGFIAHSWKGRVAELMAISTAPSRSNAPPLHVVASWRPDEQPTLAQYEEAATIICRETDLAGALCLYAVHGDTDDLHLHCEIGRFDPITLRPRKIAFLIEGLHRAIACIEIRQGWACEAHARYVLLEDGGIFRTAFESAVKISGRARDFERRTGAQSTERVAIERLGPLLREAKSWSMAHDLLATAGATYSLRRSGGVFILGGTTVKGSAAGGDLALAALEKRLGPYQDSVVAVSTPEGAFSLTPLLAESDPLRAHWDRYRDDCIEAQSERDRRRRSKNAQSDAEASFAKKQAQEAQTVLSAASLSKPARAIAQSLVKTLQKEQIDSFCETGRQDSPVGIATESFEKWLRMKNLDNEAADWRARPPTETIGQGEIVGPAGASIQVVVAHAIASTTYRVREAAVDYFFTGPRRDLDTPDLIDVGAAVRVMNGGNDRALRAAVRLASLKWPTASLRFRGPDSFQRAAARVATEHDMRVINPDLFDIVVSARRCVARGGASEEGRLFARYHAAIGADGYNVTSIKDVDTGERLAMVLGRGLCAGTVLATLPEMLRLQSRQENLFLTPISARMHHLLVDDLSHEALAQMRAEGFRPCVVIESSPRRLQAILNAPMRGNPEIDREIGNLLTRQLNQKFGDPNLSGGVHPHRAPGFRNRKKARVLDDGTSPIVALLDAEPIVCPKANAMAQTFATQMEAVAQPAPAAKARPREAPCPLEPIVAIYRRHYEAAARLVGAIEVDASRIDSMVAVRMRVTGHSRAAIARAIEAGAPARGARHHNWSDYARRTVGYAFSLTGDRKAAELAGYRSHWLAIEGNGPAHSFSKKQPKPRQASAIKAPKLPENLVVAPTSATPSKPRETEASPKPMQKRPAASKGIE